MRHNIVREQGKATSATVFHRGRVYVAATDHPNFASIIEALEQGRPPKEVIDLFDASSVIARGFRTARKLISAVADSLSGENRELAKVARAIEVKDKRIFFMGEQVHGAMADTILRFQREGNEDYLPIVRFMAKVMENPNEHSRQHLYNWMKNKSFVIHEDGDIIAYKGVRSHDKSGYLATTNGPGLINGKAKSLGLEAQGVGDVVSMPREHVTFDPHQGCAAGLHVGTWEFASSYGNKMIEVKLHPKDVVSVPTDSGWQKMRVCRYTLLREVTVADAKLLRSKSLAAS